MTTNNENVSRETNPTNPDELSEKSNEGIQGTTNTFQDQAARLLKIKVDGIEEELPEEEVIKYAQKGRYADKTIQEANNEKKRILRLREIAQQDPMAVLREFNPDFDEDNYFKSKLEKQFERNMLSKEEQERDDALAELQQYKQREQQTAKQKEDEEFDKLVVQSRQELDKEISEALSSISMKPSKATVKRLAQYMLMARNENLNLSAKDLAGQVKQDMIDEYMEQLELSDDETFASMIGEKNLTRSQKIALSKMKKTNTNVATVSKPKDNNQPTKQYGFDNFLKQHIKG